MRLSRKKRDDYFWGYFLIAPVTLGLAVFYFYPFFQVVFDSFYKIGSFDRRMGFVGLKNYTDLLSDKEMWQTLVNTFKYVVVIVPTTIAGSLGIAMLLNTKVKGLSTFRMIYFLPAVTSAAAVSLVWRWIFSGDYGIINSLLNTFGMDSVQWLNGKDTAIYCICCVAIWSNVGYYMIILLAGLQGISQEYYEAAQLDGATSFQQFRNITLPLLTPSLFYVMIMLIIATFQTFDGIYLMIGTKSGATKYAQSMVMYFYRVAFDYSNKGYASAIAVFLFMIIMLITLFQMKMQKKWVNYD